MNNFDLYFLLSYLPIFLCQPYCRQACNGIMGACDGCLGMEHLGTAQCFDQSEGPMCQIVVQHGGWATSHACPATTCYPGNFLNQNIQSPYLSSYYGCCKPCPPSYYCPGITTKIPILCPHLFFCPGGTDKPSICTKGNVHCNGTGLSQPLPCPFPCPKGSYRPYQAIITWNNTLTNVEEPIFCPCALCPAGSYAPIEGTLDCITCPQGKYFNATGASECMPCPDPPLGFYKKKIYTDPIVTPRSFIPGYWTDTTCNISTGELEVLPCDTQCPPEMYNVSACTSTRNLACQKCTECQPYQTELVPCTSASNRVCGTCSLNEISFHNIALQYNGTIPNMYAGCKCPYETFNGCSNTVVCPTTTISPGLCTSNKYCPGDGFAYDCSSSCDNGTLLWTCNDRLL